MLQMNLSAGYPAEFKDIMRNALLKRLPGFAAREDNSLFLVYHGCLIELTPQTWSHSVDVSVAIHGDDGLLTRNVSDLSFDLLDVESIVKTVGEIMQKARTSYYQNL